ncbi:TPA: hypothetical protein N0F65_010728 [Lagenidium giganteum]|uniref:Amino acid transporter n=1 Tax=Lagenidium giganteum TaxID=4803 RepID=A0AAV2YMF0_9STRA|nr:TPA: hypothetical protein N0F65_010728 [Lagenidium giganteum]
MVFASLTTGIATIVQLGKTSAIGVRTAIWFMMMSTVCATLSLVVALAWRSVHPEQMFQPRQRPQLLLSLTCTNGKFVEMVSETITCSADVESASTRFELLDITKAIVRGRRPGKRGLSDQITDIIFSLVPNNIMESFQQGAVMAVITFSLSFGAAAIANDEHDSPLLLVLAHMSNAFFYIITWVIDWSPIGVFSLVASSFVSLGPPDDAGMGAGRLMLCNLVCVLLVQLVIYPILLWFTTRRRPFKYMWQMLSCATFAFGCASSLVTLPVTLRCVESTREVSRALLHFVLTVGSIVHKNGTAMLFPNAVVFLAATASSEIKIGIAQMVIIIVVSVLASIGAAPIPNSGLFMVFSVWASAFPNDNVPTTFSYLVAIYWYIDRMSTLCNVLGDTYVARIIAEHVDETFESSEG